MYRESPRRRGAFRAVGDGAFDGGIAARVKDDGAPQSVDRRIHTIGPGRACVVCLDALRMSDVSLDRSGKLDDPDYISGLSKGERARLSRRNSLLLLEASRTAECALRPDGTLRRIRREVGVDLGRLVVAVPIRPWSVRSGVPAAAMSVP